MESKQKITLVTLDDSELNVSYPVFTVVEHVFDDMQDYSMPNWMRKADKKNSEKRFNVSLHYYGGEAKLVVGKGRGDVRIPSVSGINLSYDLVSHYSGMYTDSPLIVMPDIDGKQTNSLVRVLPTRKCSQFVRVWRDTDRHVYDMIWGDERLKRQLSQITSKHLGFDLTLYPEHIGNVYEVEFNPVFRHLEMKGTEDGIHMYFTFREPGRHSLKVRVVNYHHSDLIVEDKTLSFQGIDFELFFPIDSPDLLDVYIYDENDRLIYFVKSVTFIRSIRINTRVASKECHLEVNKRSGKRSEIIHKYGRGENTVIGAYGTDEHNLFSLPLSANDQTSVVFVDGEPSKAEENKAIMRKAIVDILSKAKDDCYVCDPYFTAMDLADYIWPLPQLYVKVNILNSRECLAPDYKDKNSRLAELLRIIDEYNGKIGADQVSCRMLNENILHDRFIVADDKVWIIGSSLSEIGKRATTITEVPQKYCRNIRNKIIDWWENKSTKLTDDAADNPSK